MTKGIIEYISKEDNTAVIALETGRSVQVELDMLPEGVELDDFVILDKGLIKIDPDNEKLKIQLFTEFNDRLNKQ